MVISFLQTRRPSILPSLQQFPETERSEVDDAQPRFTDDVERLRGCGVANQDSLGKLLFGFFRHYGYEMDYQDCVISVREGRVLSRKEKGWDASNYHNKEARSRLCVEEPFNTFRNLGNSADDYAFSGIHEEIRRAFDLIADGKLDECCQQYEFPPEEKTIFQRPAPKPKPTLTRSASQSGRTHANSVGAKGSATHPRTSRNTSSHRNNNRRASSGAAFGNHRFPLIQSPPVMVNGNDYFGTNGISTDQLHEQLYKQYQLLQAQQEALRSQLLQQQHTVQFQAQVQSGLRNLDHPTVSPRQRQFAHTMPSPKVLQHPPNTAPLLPGYLYHYPARYPVPSSPLSMARSRDETPLSPVVTTNMTASRRGTQRSIISDGGSSASTRSQSQPGRSFPNPIALQSIAHPGYDVSGAIGTPYLVHRPIQYIAQQHGGAEYGGPMQIGSVNGSIDPAMPKEYVGYYVGQSPQLGPQYVMSGSQVPIMGNVPQQHRRLSPERPAPILSDGLRRISRSPSPLSQGRSPSVSSNARSAPLPQSPFTEIRKPSRASGDGPIIVNGSTAAVLPALQQTYPVIASSASLVEDAKVGLGLGACSPRVVTTSTPEQNQAFIDTAKQGDMPTALPNGSHTAVNVPSETRMSHDATALTSSRSLAGEASPKASPSLRARAPPKLELSPKIETTRDPSVVSSSMLSDDSSMVTAPLLSPVAELRTPSPTSSKGLGSPQRHVGGGLSKTAQVTNGKLAENRNEATSVRSSAEAVIANGTMNGSMKLHTDLHQQTQKQSLPPAMSDITNGTNLAGQWQQATRKGHKKGKSQGSDKANGNVKTSGEPLPTNEADRKGG